ncbi:MAG: YbaB/EbfC family nucleoid-associated protein [Chloroflexi bacterium]|jgi:DNA-binding YbaB/EbfC family protein|nr:YbaB/EbfC family nucleoid-associated protein [Chloroflexota bacterium]
MAKRSFRGKPKKKKAPQASNMMAQFQQMQEDMALAQASLEQETVTVTAGGGAISIVITGHQRLQSIEIEPELLDPEDVEMLQDMLVAGINSAIEQSQAMSAERMEGITGSMGGLNDMLGGLGLG